MSAVNRVEQRKGFSQHKPLGGEAIEAFFCGPHTLKLVQETETLFLAALLGYQESRLSKSICTREDIYSLVTTQSCPRIFFLLFLGFPLRPCVWGSLLVGLSELFRTPSLKSGLSACKVTYLLLCYGSDSPHSPFLEPRVSCISTFSNDLKGMRSNAAFCLKRFIIECCE